MDFAAPPMIWLTDHELFRSPDVPIAARKALTLDPTDRISAEAVKIIFVLSGSSHITSADGLSELAPGDVVTVPEGTWYSASPFGYVTTVTLFFRSNFVRDQVGWLPHANPMRHKLEGALRNPGVIQLLDVGAAAMDSMSSKLYALTTIHPHPSELLRVFVKATEIFDDIAQLGGRTDLGATPITRWSSPLRTEIATAIRLLRKDLNHNWNIYELARAVSLSESQLTRLFRHEIGISPAAFLWRARTDELAGLLASRDISVAEAARETGWATPAAASRAFRRRFGVTPLQFSNDARGR